MLKLSPRLGTGAAIALFAALSLVACSTAIPSTGPKEPQQAEPAAAPFDTPTVSISYELDGEIQTASTELAVSSCSSHAFTAMAADGHSGSAIFPTPEQTDRTQITATVFGDSVVAFQGNGSPEFLEDAGVLRAYVAGLSGTATITVNSPDATTDSDSAGPAHGVEVAASLTATLECKR